jgi:acyl-coenzyme A thioesterase PaaI-like protein
VSDGIFRSRGDGVFEPSEHARGPWDPGALHGGAPAALIAGAFERAQPTAGLQIARLDFQFLRPVPMEPLRLTTRVLQAGRRAARMHAQLERLGADGDGSDGVVCQAAALSLAVVPDELPSPAPADGSLPGPQGVPSTTFSLDGRPEASFATTGMEMRWLRGAMREPGPAVVWMRLRRPVVDGEPVTPVMRLAAAADFGNGVGAALSWDEWLFVNADLTIYCQRAPQGDWIALDARTHLTPGGTGLAVSELHDQAGPVGLAQQALVVQRR